MDIKVGDRVEIIGDRIEETQGKLGIAGVFDKCDDMDVIGV